MRLFALLLLPLTVHANEIPPNSANIELIGEVTGTLTIGGEGCHAGFTWHTTHGGCRRKYTEQRTETKACPEGEVGQLTRTATRFNYLHQSTGHIASDPWTYTDWTGRCDWEDESPTPTREDSVQVASLSNGLAAQELNLYVWMQKSTLKLWCDWTGNVWNPGPHQMPADGIIRGDRYADSGETHPWAWCIPQPNGGMHFGHMYASSYIVHAIPRSNTRVDFSYSDGQMLFYRPGVSGDNPPVFERARSVNIR